MSNEEFDDGGSLLDQDFEKTPSISFRDATIGQKLILRIEELPTEKVQRKDYTTGELKWWPVREKDNGEQRPMMNTFIKFLILDGSDTWTFNAEDDEHGPAQEVDEIRNWWVNLPSQGLAEFQLKHKLLKQTAGDPKAYKTTFGQGDNKIVLGPEFDVHRHARFKGFVVGDVIELRYDAKRKIPNQSPQKLYKITWLRNETPAERSIFDED